MSKRPSDSDESLTSKSKRHCYVQQSTLPDKSASYSASGVKDALHGIAFQWKILMLLAQRCHEKGYSFRLATEMDEAEKFDDVVFWYINPNDNAQHSIFLQAKHIQLENENKSKISLNDLLTDRDGRFSLQKYFISYQKIINRKLGQNEKFYIYTNIEFDFDGNFQHRTLKKLSHADHKTELYFQLLDEKDDLLNCPYESGESYKLFLNSTCKEERQTVMNELKKLFEGTSEFQKLSDELADCLVHKKVIELKGLFKIYQHVIVKYIIDIKFKKIRQEFAAGGNLSPELAIFREKLGKSISVQTQNQDLSTFLNNVQVNISSGYQDIFIPENSPYIENPQKLAEELVKIIINKRTKNTSSIQLAQTGKKQNIFINQELTNLAGHVFVKGRKEKTYEFSNRFLNNKDLVKNIEEFRNELINQLQNHFKSRNQHEILVKLKEISFIIGSFNTCEENEFEILLSTEYQLPKREISEQKIENFLNCLVFAVNQPNEKKLSEIISTKFQKLFNLVDANLITNDFEHKVLDWLKDKKGSYLSEENMFEFFSELSEKIAQLILIGPTSEYTRKLSSFNLEFLPDHLDAKINTFLNETDIKRKIFHIVVDQKSILLGSIKFNHIIKLKLRGSFIFVKLSTLKHLQDEVMDAFNSNTINLLVIEIDSTNAQELHCLYKKICTQLSVREKKLVLIAAKDDSFIGKFKEVKHFSIEEESKKFWFTDLNISSQENLLKTVISFQGIPVCLNDILSIKSPSVQFLSLDHLIAKIESKKLLKIGKPLFLPYGYDESFYIGRTLNLFVEVNHSKLDDLVLNELSQPSNKKAIKLNWLIKDPNEDKWVDRSGFVSELREELNSNPELSVQLEVPYPPDAFDRCLEQTKLQKVILISDTAGMGKSTVLSRISKEIKQKFSSYWVMRIDLNDYTNTLRDHIHIKINILEFFIEKILKIDSEFEKTLFEEFLHDNKVIIFMDGFDEISPEFENIVINIIYGLKETAINQLWVTTRLHLKEKLETKLGVQSCTLKPFTIFDQVEFLNMFWCKKCDIKNASMKRIEYFGELLLDHISISMSGREEVLMGIPLQTRIIAELFQKEFLEFYYSDHKEPNFSELFSLVKLYDKFLDRKFDIFIEEKLKSLTSNQAAQGVRNREIKYFRKQHQYLALHLLLSKNDADDLTMILNLKSSEIEPGEIVRIGVVKETDQKLHFIHRTFAEYYLALFLEEFIHFEKTKKILMNTIFSRSEFEVVRRFLDSFLSRKLNKQHEFFFIDYLEPTAIENILLYSVEENNLEIIQCFMNCIKINPEMLKLVISKSRKSILHAASQGNQKFSEVFFSFFADNIWSDLLKDYIVDKFREIPTDGLVWRFSLTQSSILAVAVLYSKIAFIEWFLMFIVSRFKSTETDTLRSLFLNDMEGVISAYALALCFGNEIIFKIIFKTVFGMQEMGSVLKNRLLLCELEHGTSSEISRSETLERVQQLISSGADVNSISHTGKSALYFAIENNTSRGSEKYNEIIKILLKNGAELKIEDENNDAAFYLANNKNLTETEREWLLEKFENDKIVQKQREAPLNEAVRLKHLEIIEALKQNT